VHCSINEIASEGVSYRSGLEFVNPAEHVVRALTAYVVALKAAREGHDDV